METDEGCLSVDTNHHVIGVIMNENRGDTAEGIPANRREKAVHVNQAILQNTNVPAS